MSIAVPTLPEVQLSTPRECRLVSGAQRLHSPTHSLLAVERVHCLHTGRLPPGVLALRTIPARAHLARTHARGASSTCDDDSHTMYYMHTHTEEDGIPRTSHFIVKLFKMSLNHLVLLWYNREGWCH